MEAALAGMDEEFEEQTCVLPVFLITYMPPVALHDKEDDMLHPFFSITCAVERSTT
jgi:hypothetical protein